jgi:hypothetical protein
VWLIARVSLSEGLARRSVQASAHSARMRASVALAPNLAKVALTCGREARSGSTPGYAALNRATASLNREKWIESFIKNK